jgi:hypothetical protein
MTSLPWCFGLNDTKDRSAGRPIILSLPVNCGFSIPRGGSGVSQPWPIYRGIGLVAHGYTVYGTNDQRREAEIESEMRRLRGGDR